MAGSAINLTGMIAQMNSQLGRSGGDVSAGLFNPILQMQADERLRERRAEEQAQANANMIQREQLREQRAMARAKEVAVGVSQMEEIDRRLQDPTNTEEQKDQLRQLREVLEGRPGVSEAVMQRNVQREQIANAQSLQATRRAQALETQRTALQRQVYGALVAGADPSKMAVPAEVMADAQREYAKYTEEMSKARELARSNVVLSDDKVPEAFLTEYKANVVQFGPKKANSVLANAQVKAWEAERGRAIEEQDAYNAASGEERVHILMSQSKTDGNIFATGTEDMQEKYIEADPEEQDAFRKEAAKQYNRLRPTVGEKAAMSRAMQHAASIMGWAAPGKAQTPTTDRDPMQAIADRMAALEAEIAAEEGR